MAALFEACFKIIVDLPMRPHSLRDQMLRDPYQCWPYGKIVIEIGYV